MFVESVFWTFDLGSYRDSVMMIIEFLGMKCWLKLGSQMARIWKAKKRYTYAYIYIYNIHM